MTLSIRRLQQKGDFGHANQKSFKLIESSSLGMARKKNKLEEEILERKLFKLEEETSTSLIKLCKNIYETSIELNSINFELKRNKLETIYKNYNYCKFYRNQNKNKPKQITEKQTEELHGEASLKEDKLNKFLLDMSTKTETEVTYLLNNKPNTTTCSAKKVSYPNRLKSSTNIIHPVKVFSNSNIQLTQGPRIASVSGATELVLEPKKEEAKNSKEQQKSIDTNLMNQSNDHENTKNILNARPQTSIHYRRGNSVENKKTRKRAASISKIDFQELKNATDEENYLSKKNSESFIIDSNNIKNKVNSEQSKAKSKVKDKSMLKINDLYQKSVDNLDYSSLKLSFNSNSLDDDDWLSDLETIRAKHRENIIKNRSRYRVCTAWVAKLEKNNNIELTSKIRQNRITRKMNKSKNKFDMAKEKELFELTHKNLKDLMIKQINTTVAKENETFVKEYIKNKIL